MLQPWLGAATYAGGYGSLLSRLCENSIARRRRRKFFSTIVLDGDSMLLMHPEMQFEGIVFSAFCARA
ncbi:MAG TPA: hypothetical protein VNS33_14160, partial [Bradyrhizobium sp.]|nr:hypothetical protein [Bradyrhizobium sp.]